MKQFRGWLLDIYTHPKHGKTCLWVIGEDGTRQCFFHTLPGIFYMSGLPSSLEHAENFLYDRFASYVRVTAEHTQQTIHPHQHPILAVHTPNLLIQRRVFRSLEKQFPMLEYFNTDLNATLYYAAQFDTFALCRVDALIDDDNHLQELMVLDSRWDLDLPPAPLRILELRPDSNPRAKPPTMLHISFNGKHSQQHFRTNRELAHCAAPAIRRFDPDIILTSYGDGYLLKAIESGSTNWIEPIPLNRDHDAELITMKERSYHSYGQLFYRPQAVFLSGRHHIDTTASFFWRDSGLEGLLEVARVTSQSLQRAARTTPGTGISSMQIVEALRSNILVPYKKQLPEQKRSAVHLLQHDMGGFSMQPMIGLHENVGAVDFVSMYPSLMVRCNISPECIPHGLHERHQHAGLIPRTLEPLLDKRVQLKHRLVNFASYDPQKKLDTFRIDALKWLLVCCFGYLGYKNARFGRIESHEAVTGAGREALLLAKDAAEGLDFLVLHAIVDSLFVQHPDCRTKQDFEPLLNAIIERTGLPIGLDGVFRWVAFPRSRMNPRISVPNRYFGVFQDSSLKVRGIEARRRDVPPFIKETQMAVLEILAQGETLDAAGELLPEAFAYLDHRRSLLAANQVEPEELVIRHKLSRALDAYRIATPASIAAQELVAGGREPQPGEVIHFVHTYGHPPARLWHSESGIDSKDIDPRLYLRIFDRAMETILDLFHERFPGKRRKVEQLGLQFQGVMVEKGD
ncbi:MAG: hypothetical protein K8R40_01415 [Anaerolineaceae bacterium]|nr:hypothetical protein [Anaerolineaceae bacterium]